MKSKSLIFATLAVLGLGAADTTRAIAPTSATRTARTDEQRAAVKNGTTTRQIEADHFNSYASGILGQFMREGGRTPYEWGISRACARMRRKNKMHAKGISHQRI